MRAIAYLVRAPFARWQILLLVLAFTFEIAVHFSVYGFGWLSQEGVALIGTVIVSSLAIVMLLDPVFDRRYSDTSLIDMERPSRSSTVPAAGWALPAAWIFTAYFLAQLLPANPFIQLIPWLILAALILLKVFVRDPRALIGVGVVLGCLLRFYIYWRFPIYPLTSDMQPLVHKSLENFLHGQNPYQVYAMPWELPLTYLPLTWLAYLPPFVLHIDTRSMNLVADLAIGISLIGYGYVRRRELSLDSIYAVLLVWVAIFNLPILGEYAQSATAQIYWALLAVTLLALVAGKTRLAVVLLGAALATSVLIVVVLPFVAVYRLVHDGWQKCILRLLVVALIGAALVVPFWLTARENFVYGVVAWLNNNRLYPLLGWEMGRYWIKQIGFSGFFWAANAQDLLKPIQLMILLLLSVTYWRYAAQLRHLPAFATAAYLLFTAFNPVIWPYYYFVAFSSGLIALLIRAPSLSRPEGTGTLSGTDLYRT